MQTDNAGSLRLVAKDEADIEVVSTLLQDAIISGADMHYDTQHACFMIVANRFCWERPVLAGMNDSKGEVVRERVLCGLRVNYVTAVQKRRWPADWHYAFLNLLALELLGVPQQHSGHTMEFSFSGGPSMRLKTKQIEIVFSDLDSGRPTNLQPRHDL
jgi:hypothetical protein